MRVLILLAAIAQSMGTPQVRVLIFFAPSPFILIVQAHVLAVLALKLITCPVVYAVRAGVRDMT